MRPRPERKGNRVAPSNLESFLRVFQSDIQLREFQEPIRTELAEVDASMRRFFDSEIPLLQTVSGHLLGVTGKKFRPTLLLLVAGLGEPEREEMIFSATVIELIHTATLVHDDTIDRSALRRGLPTINALFNDLVSTILGDYIYTKAFHELLTRDRTGVGPVVARTVYRMSIGEMLQLQQKHNLDLTEEEYFQLVDEKTASLMAASCEVGAMVGRLPEDRVQRFHDFGATLGRAYQLTDDLFDFLGSEAEMGKGVQADLNDGKITLPFLYALSHAAPRDKPRLRSFVSERNLSPEDWPFLLKTLESSGAIEYCRERAGDLAESALGLLQKEPPSPRREALEKAVAYSVRRNH
jgi:octaprenyl-diphosphate synthase